MKWNVISIDSKSKKIKPYNIFEDDKLRLSIEFLLEKQYTKKCFLKELEEEICRFFQANTEREIIITTWPPYINAEKIERIISEYYINHIPGKPIPEQIDVNIARWQKINIYDQLRANWERFADYVWQESNIKSKQVLSWNVYKFDNSNQELNVFNVFEHRSFNFYVKKLLKQDISKEEFENQLLREVQYYYWAKFEWEFVVTGNNPHINQKELERILSECYLKLKKADPPCKHSLINLAHAYKIDVYEQLCLNWNEFVDYVWNHKNHTRRNTN